MDAKRFNLLVKNMKTDGDAFNEMYEYYYPRIVLYIKRNCNSDEGVDVAHSFFVAMLTRMTDQEIFFPSAFVYTSCRNIFVKLHNDDKKMVELNEEICAATTVENLDDRITIKDMMDGLLTEWEKTVFYLSRYEGLSLREIAVEYCVLPNEIRNTFRRAMKKLEKALKENDIR